MRIRPIIERLRENLPSWNNRIDGVAEWEAAEDKSRLVIPCMYVMYGGSSATTVSYSTFQQDIDERLRILVVLNNTLDRTGKSAQDQVHIVREALFGVLLNYQADADAFSLQFVEDKMVEMDKSRYFHVFEFKQVGCLKPEDGSPLSLDEFDKFYTGWNLDESDEENHPDAQDQVNDIYTIPE